MISLPQQLPMIQVGPGQVTACDPVWLRSTVRDAARGVNVPDWFADDVVQGVVHFLKVKYNGTVIAIGCLFDKIRHSLKDLGLEKVRLLTNNPKKVDAFVYAGIGIEVVDQLPLIAEDEPQRRRYLATKRDKLGHLLPEDPPENAAEAGRERIPGR